MGFVYGFLSRNRFALVIILTFGSSPRVAADQSNSAGPGQLDPVRLQWHTLVLESNGLLSSVEARVDLRQTPVTDVPWISMPHASVPLHMPMGETVLVLDARVDTRIGVSRKVREESVWFEAISGRVFQHLRYEGGDEPGQKYYRFGDDDIFRLRRGPENAAEPEPVENWRDVEESTYRYNGRDGGCRTIVASTTLLYIVSVVDAALHPPPWPLCVFSRRRLYPVMIAAVGEKALSVDYVENGSQESRRRQGNVMTRIIEVAVTEDPSGRATADSFYLLGMRIPIRLFVDKNTGVPVRVSGSVPNHGQGELNLHEVQTQNLR